LQEYEDKLKELTRIEADIDKIEPSHKIGAMELKTHNLCSGLKSYAKKWKDEYSHDLHKKARS
jgi:dynein heavy chain